MVTTAMLRRSLVVFEVGYPNSERNGEWRLQNCISNLKDEFVEAVTPVVEDQKIGASAFR